MKTLPERAYRHIRRKLVTGMIGGERLSEVALAKEIGVSTTPVREAMGRLMSEGLLVKVPGLGSFVRQVGRDELEELYELRQLLESHATFRAATRLTAAQLRELQRFCNQILEVARVVQRERLTKLNERLTGSQ